MFQFGKPSISIRAMASMASPDPLGSIHRQWCHREADLAPPYAPASHPVAGWKARPHLGVVALRNRLETNPGKFSKRTIRRNFDAPSCLKLQGGVPMCRL